MGKCSILQGAVVFLVNDASVRGGTLLSVALFVMHFKIFSPVAFVTILTFYVYYLM